MKAFKKVYLAYCNCCIIKPKKIKAEKTWKCLLGHGMIDECMMLAVQNNWGLELAQERFVEHLIEKNSREYRGHEKCLVPMTLNTMRFYTMEQSTDFAMDDEVANGEVKM